MMETNMTFLQECARFLLETHEEKNELKQRFTNLFFETYGQQIAGDCGCSHLVFDHQLIPVRQPEFLIDLMHATLDLGVIDCSSDHLGRNLNAVFKTKFSLSPSGKVYCIKKSNHTRTNNRSVHKIINSKQ